ncbi:MAG: GNAT family N-acetyltransferase [Roseobacter sp.]|jgi:ribosomal-protein-alanine N-acetyltransferase
METQPSASHPSSKRLEFSRFSDEDAAAFARLLSDPEVTRSIMAKATTPEQCLECAQQRIAWHNSTWDTLGYGVWALRERLPEGVPAGPIIGWCGLIATSHGPTPEILYGFSRALWGGGLATEAASATIEWAFNEGVCDGIDAVIFGPLNPGSSAVARKLGMTYSGKMRFDAFLPDQQLGRDVLDYEIWRLREGATLDFKSLLFQAPFKSGLLVSAGVADETETLSALLAAAKQRPDRGDIVELEINELVSDSFRRGQKECNLDIYHISQNDWAAGRGN